MYKILKDKGNNSNIILKNTDTNAEINLGRLTMEIIYVLEKEGFTFDESHIQLKDEWELDISKEAKHELEKLAMKMAKPSKKPKSEQITKDKPKSSREPVDVFDLIFGTN